MTPPTLAVQGNPVPPQPTTVRGRVLLLVKKWAKLEKLPKDTDLLTVLWAPQADPYNPDGAQSLVEAIQTEFAAPPVICQCITVTDLTQKITTVAKLVEAVPECPQ